MRHRILFAFAAFPALALFATSANAMPPKCNDGECVPIGKTPLEIVDEPPLDPLPAPPPYPYAGSPKPDVCEAIAPAEDVVFGVRKAGSFGNQTFGAGYELFIGIDGKAASGSRPTEVNAGGRARASATLFGTSKEIALVEAMGHATSGKEASADITVKVMGQDVYTAKRAVNLSWTPWSIQQDFFDVQVSLQIGPVPVVVGAGAGGEAGFNINVPFTTNSLGIQAKPYANVHANVSAGVGNALASVGVEGQLTLIEVAAPLTGRVGLAQNGDVAWDLGMDLELSALSGKLNAYAELLGTRYRMQIASWSAPLKATYPVFHVGNCGFQLTPPVCGDRVCSTAEDALSCPSDCHLTTVTPTPPPSTPPPGPIERVCNKKPWLCD